MARNITSANSSISFNTALGNEMGEGYSADNIFTSDFPDFAETRMGVDGKMSAGYIPTIKHLDFSFEASSHNITYFQAIATTVEMTKTPCPIVVSISLPAISKRFVCTGVVKSVKMLMDAANVLEPMTVGMDFESIVPMPM
jgi:hypothetical protein